MDNIRRRGFLKSVGALPVFGSFWEEVENYPNPPIVENPKEGWKPTESEQEAEVRVTRRIGGDLIFSNRFYDYSGLAEQISNQIDGEQSVTWAELFAFKAGKVRKNLFGDEPGNEMGSTKGGPFRFFPVMNDLFTNYISGFEYLTLEGEGYHTGITKLPGSPDSIDMSEEVIQRAAGSISNTHHDVERSAVIYELSFDFSHTVDDDGSFFEKVTAETEIGARGWLAYWGHDEYLYGAGAFHPKIRLDRVRGTYDERNYLERQLEEIFDTDVSLDVNEALDMEILDMFGEVHDGD